MSGGAWNSRPDLTSLEVERTASGGAKRREALPTRAFDDNGGFNESTSFRALFIGEAAASPDTGDGRPSSFSSCDLGDSGGVLDVAAFSLPTYVISVTEQKHISLRSIAWTARSSYLIALAFAQAAMTERRACDRWDTEEY